MSVFRRRKNGIPSKSVVIVPELVSSEVEENGVKITREVVVNRSPEDYFAKHPVPTESYSIGQQLQAGVPLKEIPCGTLLDSPDNLDYEINEIAEHKILDALEKEIENKSEKKD